MVKGWASIPENYVTHVPVLSLDRILGESLQGKKAMILIDIEGAEYMLLKGAIKTLRNNPKPIWMMEISTREHQPTWRTLNPHFIETFEIFFKEGYRAFFADEREEEIEKNNIHLVFNNGYCSSTHNYIFHI